MIIHSQTFHSSEGNSGDKADGTEGELPPPDDPLPCWRVRRKAQREVTHALFETTRGDPDGGCCAATAAPVAATAAAATQFSEATLVDGPSATAHATTEGLHVVPKVREEPPLQKQRKGICENANPQCIRPRA